MFSNSGGRDYRYQKRNTTNGSPGMSFKVHSLIKGFWALNRVRSTFGVLLWILPGVWEPEKGHCKEGTAWRFPKLRGPCLGVIMTRLMRMMVYWSLFWASLFLETLTYILYRPQS